jgi:hypothetical protein
MTDEAATRVLEWGQTPFDHLSREELLRHCQRLYAAGPTGWKANRMWISGSA